MIRSLWMIIVTLAIANFLGFIVFLTWLGATDRLSVDRMHEVRDLFGTTIAAQEVADKQAESEAAKLAERGALVEQIGTPPITAEGRARYEEEFSRAVEQRAARTSREARDRQETLFQWQRDLEVREQALQARTAAFDRMRREIEEREGSEQFAKALKVYETLPPDETAEVFQELVGQDKQEQVISFLNAMKPRIAGDVMSAVMNHGDPALAARLLEGLREHGVASDVALEEP